MNKRIIISFLLLMVMGSMVYSQNDISNNSSDSLLGDSSVYPIVEVDFLFGYYEQDGNHAAVTGGKGSELLWDYVGKTTINVQLDSFHAFSLGGGIDQYTSASTDNIDFTVSSASLVDTRKSVNVSYTRKTRKKAAFTFGGGYSTEWDVESFSGNLSWNKLSKDENRGFNLAAQFYKDKWELIYPVEFREQRFLLGQELLPNDVRYLGSVSLKFFQILNKRNQLGLFVDYTRQQGLLSTPFQRVFFSNGERDIERLPDSKWKLPVAMRLHCFALDHLVIKWFNRYYIDEFDLQAYTSNLDIALKINPYLTVTPSYRWHTQTSAKYFKPFQGHESTSQFYTSDYDLSSFQSHKLGIAFRYAPLYGLLPFRAKFMVRPLTLKELSLRFGYFKRTDGLQAGYTSFGLSWVY